MNFLEEQKRNVRTTWLLSFVFFLILILAALGLDLFLFHGMAFWITPVVVLVALGQALYACSGQIVIALQAIGIVLWLVAWIGRLLKMAVSRTREFLADATSVEFTREPEGLIEALEKIRRESLETEYGYADMDHAYFAQPHFRAASWLTSHPPIAVRIARLRAWRPRETPG